MGDEKERDEGGSRNRVLVLHGRNQQVFEQLKLFLLGLGVVAYDFDDEVRGADARIERIVDESIREAHVIIVLFTPDEYAALIPALREENDALSNTRRWLPRPNVIFEAGLAWGLAQKKTILVQIGEPRSDSNPRRRIPPIGRISNLDGVVVAELGDDPSSREQLRIRLRDLGCDVSDGNVGEGRFASAVPMQHLATDDPFVNRGVLRRVAPIVGVAMAGALFGWGARAWRPPGDVQLASAASASASPAIPPPPPAPTSYSMKVSFATAASQGIHKSPRESCPDGGIELLLHTSSQEVALRPSCDNVAIDCPKSGVLREPRDGGPKSVPVLVPPQVTLPAWGKE